MAFRSRKSVRLASGSQPDRNSKFVERFRSSIRISKTSPDKEVDFSNWHPVTVSARKILWPCLCACYGGDIGPVPDSEPILPDVNVVKVVISKFEPFYCQHCYQHQAKMHEAELLPSVDIPARDGSIYGVYAFGCIFSPCIIGFFMTIFEKFITSSDLVYFASIVTPCLIILAIHIKLIKHERQKIAAAQAEADSIENERNSLETEATRLQLPTCTALTPTVKIIESHRTIHKFMFVDESLAKLFADLNVTKIVTPRVDLASSSPDDSALD